MKIFIVEDDKKLRTELFNLLNNYDYECTSSDDYPRLCESILATKCDLVLLDLNLPQFDGHHLCRQIRIKSDIPIIVVTSSNSEMDELMSMNLGADDFITKPYNSQILLAHIEAVLKRTQPKYGSSLITCKGVDLDVLGSIIHYNGNSVELTKNEVKILSVLMKKEGTVISRDELMDALWQSDEFVDDNTLTVNVNRLRKKLKSLGAENFIVTKRGWGYLV